MIITYYGEQFFKVQQGDLTIAYNPIKEPRGTSVRVARFGADIALVSVNHPYFNGIENLSYGEKEPFSITGPGEYETRGVYVRGIETWTRYGSGTEEKGAEEQLNTVYSVLLEGVRLCFLGALDTPKIEGKIYDAINEVDVLFVPVGEGTLSSAEAHKLSLTFSPKIIIPMYDDASSLKKLLEEAGQENIKKEEKITLKKKDLEGKQGEVVVLAVS